jgi:hypothetical protein
MRLKYAYMHMYVPSLYRTRIYPHIHIRIHIHIHIHMHTLVHIQGVNLSHNNIVSNLKGIQTMMAHDMDKENTSLCFLPWSHVFGLVCLYVFCMYVCMCACMYVYMYVCMYVCLYACMYAFMFVCMYKCTNVYICRYAIIKSHQISSIFYQYVHCYMRITACSLRMWPHPPP